jgi:hypothetical protein
MRVGTIEWGVGKGQGALLSDRIRLRKAYSAAAGSMGLIGLIGWAFHISPIGPIGPI